MVRRPRGSGHVYRPKTKNAAGELKEQAVWWIAYRSGGKLHRESTGTAVKTDAEKVLRARTAAVDSGNAIPAEAQRTTLDDLAVIVKTDYENNGRASGSEVERAFDRLRDHFGGKTLARAITPDRIEKYKAARLAAKAKAATVNRELAQLRRAFRLAMRLRRVESRPDFSLLTEGRPRQGFFEAEQFESVHRHLPAYLRPLVTFLYWTGWRKSEVLGLEWRMVDRKAGVIRIEDTKNRVQRTIPYAKLAELKAVIEEQHKRTEALRKDGTLVPYVFHRYKAGKRIKTFAGAWDVACAKAGVPGRLVHDFRRTAARAMLRAGIPQAVAMMIGGWKTDSVFRRYAIVDERVIGENMEKLGAVNSR